MHSAYRALAGLHVSDVRASKSRPQLLARCRFLFPAHPHRIPTRISSETAFTPLSIASSLSQRLALRASLDPSAEAMRPSSSELLVSAGAAAASQRADYHFDRRPNWRQPRCHGKHLHPRPPTARTRPQLLGFRTPSLSTASPAHQLPRPRSLGASSSREDRPQGLTPTRTSRVIWKTSWRILDTVRTRRSSLQSRCWVSTAQSLNTSGRS